MVGRTVLFAALVVCCWPWSVCTQGGVRFSLNGTVYQNNSLVTLEDIGEWSEDDALLCLTDQTGCCRYPYTGYWGNWYFPNGTRVPAYGIYIQPDLIQWGFYRTRGHMVVRLHRRRGGEDGIYHCKIHDAMNVTQTIYIGLYTADTGFPRVYYVIYDDQSRTLTCASYGGPATTVTWRRHGVVITLNATYQQTKKLVDPGWGTYQTVLTIDPSVSQSDLVGTYNCTVENDRGESSRIVVIPGNGTGAGVRFWLRGTTYQNNSLVNLEEIGEWEDALFCVTDEPGCCQPSYYTESGLGNWFFPNGSRIPSSWGQWDFYRTRSQMVVNMHRRRSGVTGIYSCEIPDARNVILTIYIGVYTADTGFPRVTYLGYDSRSRTLTCTSTGGPATAVTWRRDGVVITLNTTYQQTKKVVDPVTGTYQMVLTIDTSVGQSDIVGLYSCIVENARGESSGIMVIPGSGKGVRFSLRGTVYQNNSLVSLENIGIGGDALLCVTDQPACCRHPYTGESYFGLSPGHWFFPNGSRLPSSGQQWDFFRTRGRSMVRMHRWRGGVSGIYHCEIPDAMNVTQTIYIGVYTGSTGFPRVYYLRYDNQFRTLTCVSYGGPATAVTWRRDGVVITLNATYQQTKRVVYPGWGTYQTVLTIDPSVLIVGTYNCTVENARGRSSVIVIIGEGVRFWFRGTTYQNNSLVTLEDIGEWDNALLCVTDLTACCRHFYTGEIGSPLGNWFFPNGTRIPSFYANYTTRTLWDFFRSRRGQMIVHMHRRRGGVNGIYSCEIPDAMNVTQTIYIGVYTANTGQVTIPGELTFQLNTDPATDPPVFTLTCTSTGGPATTVSWRRNGVALTDNSYYSIIPQILLDSETATYTHTLTVTGRLVGQYQCSVSNIRTPSGSSRSLTVVAAGLPTNLNAVQVNLTSFRVYWTPPATVTGYQVYWSGGGGYDSGNMSAGAEDRTVTVTGRTPGLTYNITIVALSDHLPSPTVGALMVTLACPQVTDSEYLVSAVVGTFIGTTLLYTMVLIVSICALIYWNKKHRTTTDTQVTQVDAAIVMKECDAYGEITVTGTDHIYATPHVHTTPQ